MNQIAPMAAKGLMDFTPKQLDLIRRTVAADLVPDEFDMFISIARQNGLDPFKKQIYAIVYNKDNQNKRKVSFITGIGGYRAIAQRSGLYRPDEEAPRIIKDDALKSEINPLGIECAEVTINRYGPDGKWYPITGRAYWAEFAPIKEEWAEGADGKRRPTGKMTLDTGGNWGKMPHVMLAKCAEADALRKGWPEDLGALYVDAEMDRATTIDLTATEVVEQERTARRQAALGGPNMVTVTFEFSEGLQAIPAGQFADRCIEWINQLDSAESIANWQEYNRVALKQFWGTNPGDALELKKVIEARIEAFTKEKVEA